MAPLALSQSLILSAFAETKKTTDLAIARTRFGDYSAVVGPAQTHLCVVLVVEALARMRCDLHRARPGQVLRPVRAVEKASPAAQNHLEWCYRLLEGVGLVRLAWDDEGGRIATVTRTAEKLRCGRSADELRRMVKEQDPSFESFNRLVYLAGTRLAEVWSGKVDAVAAIFGSAEGRPILEDIYGPAHPCVAFHGLMETFVSRVVSGIKADPGMKDGSPTLNILELGAGTGGTTKWLAPCLAAGGVPTLYTFSDIAPGFCAQAARKYGPIAAGPDTPLSMDFKALDIESPAPTDMRGTQHLVVAVNAVHATADIAASLANMRGYLRPGGVALIMELSKPIHSADFVFGLFDGWWLFEDGRTHATAEPEVWQDAFLRAGFADVDWTEGEASEAEVMRVYLGVNA